MSPQERILVVEDDVDVARLVEMQLRQGGYQVRVNASGAGFIAEVEEWEPELIVLDLMLPRANGLDLLAELRRHPRLSARAVILLTALGEEADRVRGLDLGADDYLTKPFSARELVARVRARLRSGPREAPAALTYAELSLDLRARQATLRGAPLELSDTEFRLLAFLMKDAGKAFSRREIVDAVWSPQHFITERTVDVYMLRLRGKIEETPEEPRYLLSVRRVGYRFNPHADKPEAAEAAAVEGE